MKDRKADIIAELKRSEETTAVLFEQLNEEQLERPVYADGAQWRVGEVLAHLITIEGSMQRLFEDILRGRTEAAKAFDIERFNRSQPRKLAGLRLPELIRRFRQVREMTVQMVADMRDADLDREGWHPFHGPGRLERFLRWAYEHAAQHGADVRRALEP